VVLYGWRKSLCSPTIGLTERGLSYTPNPQGGEGVVSSL